MVLVIKHIFIEGPGTLSHFFDREKIEYKIIELSQDETFPESLDQIDGVIVLGGPMNVYEEDDFPYLKEENLFIQSVLGENIPFLGICLGSQLLAKASGAQVKKARQKEHGFSLVSQTAQGMQDPLFDGLGEQLIAFQWHEDTFDVPDGGMLLTTSAACAHQAVKIGANAYGLQYHIEVDHGIIESWIKKYFNVREAGESKEGRKMLEQYVQVKSQYNKQASLIYQNFKQLVDEYKQQKAAA